MRKLRVGVVGAGRLGGFHAQKLAAMPQAELIAVADPLPGARDRVAAACHVEALDDPRNLHGRVDAVVIAAPTRLHHALGLEFLARGTHVLMEKPLATTAAEGEELVETARRNGAVLQVGHVERFNPAFEAAAPYLRGPKFIEAVRTSPFTFRSTDVGAVLDMMIHDLDLIHSLVRTSVAKVEALGISVLGGHEDVAHARLEFECGCVAVLSASRVSFETQRRMQAWAPRAFAGVDFAARTATIVQPSETLLQRRFDVQAISPEQVENAKSQLTEEHLPQKQFTFAAVDALALELDDFIESIRAPRLPRVTGQQGLAALQTAELILAKIAAHAWDATSDGRIGPLGVPRPRVIPAPHFDLSAAQVPLRKREAG